MSKRPIPFDNMLTSFDGNSSKRNISMGGRKREDDKSAVLARARTERLTRETERKKLIAAGNIQKWWRGRASNAATKNSFRTKWDEQVTNLQTVVDTFKLSGIPFSPPVASILIFSKQFLFFSSSSKIQRDRKRLVQLAKLILLSIQTESQDETINFAAVCLKTSTTAPPLKVNVSSDEFDKLNEWVHLTSRLLSVTFDQINQIAQEGSLEEVDICCEMISTLTNTGITSFEDSNLNLFHPTVKVIQLISSKSKKKSIETLIQNKKLVRSLTNKSIQNYYNPLFHCLGERLQQNNDHDIKLNEIADIENPSQNLSISFQKISQISLILSLNSLKIIQISSKSSLSKEKEKENNVILKHFIEEVLYIANIDKNVKLFHGLSEVLLSREAVLWWQVVSKLVHLYQNKEEEMKPVVGFGFTSNGGGGGGVKVTENKDIPLTAVANLLGCLDGHFSGLSLQQHQSQGHSLMFLLHNFVANLPPCLSYASGTKIITKVAAAAESSMYDEEDDEDELGNVSMSNGIKGLELRVTQERRRRLLASPRSATNLLHEENVESVIHMLCKPTTVSALFDAILPIDSNNESTVSSTLQNSQDSVMLLCATYGLLLTHGPHRSTSLLPILALKVPHFISRLWGYLVNHSKSVVLTHPTPLPSSSSLSSSSSSSLSASVPTHLTPQSSVLLSPQDTAPTLVGASVEVKSTLFLLVATCSRLLLSLDDEDFFTNHKMISLAGQLEMSSMLRAHLMEMLWEDPCFDRVGDLVSLELLNTSARLFNQIYDRHARREFLMGISRDHWHWPQLINRELLGGSSSGNAAASTSSSGEENMNFGSRRASLVLTCVPQVIPFVQRVLLFQTLIDRDKESLGISDRFSFMGTGVHDVTIARETIYEDALATLDRLGPHLKGRIRVTFDSDLGYQEAGIDGGGLFRDFMDKLTEKCFDPASVFFKETSDHLLYPDPDSAAVPQCLKHFEFMGRVLGKAVYDQILLRPQFAAPFLNKLLDRNNVIDDLYTIDPELYKHLLSLKTLAKTEGVNLEDLCLFFTVGTGDKHGVKSEVELVKNGRNIPVTNSNHLEYIYRVAHFKLNSETSKQSKYFLRGFHDLIPVDWIKMFDAHELQMVIGGEQRGIDIENMKKFTSYGGGYHESQPFIQWFWEILTDFTPDQQSDFLKFVTSSSRQPLLGFEFMNPPFCIQKVPLDAAGQKLPSAGTCMSLLKLPAYRDKETMRSKILYAISSNSGFELS